MSRRKVRVTPRQAQALERRLDPVRGAPQAAEDGAGREIAFSGGSRPGFATHVRDTTQPPIECRVCGQPTRHLYAKMDGIQLGDWMCDACQRRGPSDSRRRKAKDGLPAKPVSRQKARASMVDAHPPGKWR